MKTCIVLFTLLAGSTFTSSSLQAQASIPAPPCKQVVLDTDTTRRRILSDFIDASLTKKRFINDKGIVQLNIYKNALGLTCWMLIPHIDDSYKDNPPPAFADFEGDIILVYSADVNGYALKTPDPAPLNKCLEDIIGDRIYIRSTKKGRWADYVIPGMGLRKTQGRHRMEMGNGGAIIIIFQKDGTYKTIYPA